MRLTLRTLLAYIDDTVEPSVAVDLGQKVAHSPRAKEMIQRIREVTHTPRVGLPSTGEGGLAIETVAAYLDNGLPDAQVARFEEACLSDDACLAEVASCHQILALTKGEPYALPDRARVRMKRMGEHLVRAGGRVPGKRPGSARAAVERAGREPRRWQSLLGAAAVIVILLALIALLVWMIFTTRPSEVTDRGEPSQVVAQAPPDGPAVRASPATASTERSSARGASSRPDRGPKRPPADATPTRTPQSQPDAAGAQTRQSVSPHPAAHAGPKPTGTDAHAAPSPDTASRTGKRPVASGPTPTESVTRNLARYTSTDSVLLRFDTQMGEWVRLAGRAWIDGGERVMELDGYRSVVRVPTPAVAIHLHGYASLRLLRVERQGVLHWEMLGGHVSLTSPTAPTTYVLHCAGERLTISHMEPKTTLYAHLVRNWPDGAPLGPRGAKCRLDLVVGVGRLCLKPGKGDEPVRQFQAPFRMSWDPSYGVFNGRELAKADDAVPPWAQVGAGRSGSRRGARRLAAMVPQEDQPAITALRKASESRDRDTRRLATWALVRVGSPDQILNLLTLTDDTGETRRAVLDVLRNSMAARPAEWAKLRSLLRQRTPPGAVQSLDQLLVGYGLKQRQKRDTYEQLIQLLANDDVLVRSFAIHQLARLTGQTFNYRAEAYPDVRRRIMLRWESWLMKFDPSSGGRGTSRRKTPAITH